MQNLFLPQQGAISNPDEKQGSTTTLPVLNKNKFARLFFPLPPLVEQRTIVDVLTTIEKKVELAKKSRHELNKVKRGLIDDLLTGKVGLRGTNVLHRIRYRREANYQVATRTRVDVYCPRKISRDAEEPFDLFILKEVIRRFNSAVIQTDNDIDAVINHLKRFSNDINGNREFGEWIKGEKSIVLHPGEKAQVVRLIDTNPENNTFVVTNHFKFSGYENVRFDIVLMVNGIPLAMIEAKVPTKENLDYHEAIKQILRYYRDAPQFFKHLALVCATDGINFRYDWVTPANFAWKR